MHIINDSLMRLVLNFKRINLWSEKAYTGVKLKLNLQTIEGFNIYYKKSSNISLENRKTLKCTKQL